ncbi:prephenate dehydrogenase/arogenate dehydrogenase family protein [Candidatus Saccharibacteria bacterium]|nr:prephenate dehydrogenase/arogenate dehydrogenase family protein [Candidatus Saccharibacteria bacterium]
MKKSIGVIGFGAFGAFIAPILARHFEVLVSTRRKVGNPPKGVSFVSLEQAANCNIVVLSVNAQAIEEVLLKIKPLLRPGTLVIDVCSVKVMPVKLMNKILPTNVQVLGTHPVFGPESGKHGIAGLPVALCPVRIDAKTLARIKDFLQNALELEVVEISPEDHDREMAYALALTHLISRSLNNLPLPELKLPTKSYKLLQAVRGNLQNDSIELFHTIQNYNSFAKQVRRNFVKRVQELEHKIETHDKNNVQ